MKSRLSWNLRCTSLDFSDYRPDRIRFLHQNYGISITLSDLMKFDAGAAPSFVTHPGAVVY